MIKICNLLSISQEFDEPKIFEGQRDNFGESL